MKSRNIFVYNSPDFLKNVSKKGTESDITIHHRKDGETISTFLEPTRYPEKISSLTDCVYPADTAVVGGDVINRDFGEVILTLDLMEKRSGYILVSSEERKEQVSRVIKGTVAENYTFFTGSPMELMEVINSSDVQRNESERTVVIIDHFFKVKSVGTVALGFVLEGTLHRHQKLALSDGGKEVQIRSIQMHDEDQESAPCGSRVGLALKNVDADDLGRGMFLSSYSIPMSDTLSKPVPHPMTGKKDVGDIEIFVSDGMRYQRGFIGDGVLKLERPVPAYRDSVIATSPNLTPRIIGLAKFTGETPSS